MTYDLHDLDAYLRGEGITRFAAQEICPVGKEVGDTGIVLQLAPHILWPNIIPTLRVLQDAREHFGKPIIVLSGYRDPDYNRAVGGEQNSLHMSFNAVDIRIKDVDPLVYALWLNKHKDAKYLGIGLYRKSSFVHTDARGYIKRPAPARWDYETNSTWWVPPKRAA